MVGPISFDPRLTLGSLIQDLISLGFGITLLTKFSKVVEPLMRRFRQVDSLVDNYNIETECDDVKKDPKTGMKPPEQVARKRAQERPSKVQ